MLKNILFICNTWRFIILYKQRAIRASFQPGLFTLPSASNKTVSCQQCLKYLSCADLFQQWSVNPRTSVTANSAGSRSYLALSNGFRAGRVKPWTAATHTASKEHSQLGSISSCSARTRCRNLARLLPGCGQSQICSCSLSVLRWTCHITCWTALQYSEDNTCPQWYPCKSPFLHCKKCECMELCLHLPIYILILALCMTQRQLFKKFECLKHIKVKKFTYIHNFCW